MTYPQPQQQFPPQYGYSQAPGGPPQRRRPHPGLIVGAVVAFAAVVAVLITGFVAPGFFLADDEAQPTGPALPPPASVPPAVPNLPPPADTSVMSATASTFLVAVNAGDAREAATLTCEDLDSIMAESVRQAIGRGVELHVSGPADGGDLTKSGVLPVTGNDGEGKQVSGNLVIRQGDDGAWCASTMQLSGS